jgi:PAS domain S-box-containing protein
VASRERSGSEATAVVRLAELETENARLRERLARQDETLGQLKALSARESQIRLVADSLPVLISYIDAGQRYRFNNKAYERWFGHRRKDMFGKHLRDVLGDAAYEALRPIVEKVLSGERVSADRRLAYKDGGERAVHIEYVPDRTEDGRTVGFFALVQDISEREQVERTLRESEARFRSMADSAAAPVWVTNENGIEFVNHAMTEFAGLPPERLLGDVWMGLVHPDDLPPVLALRNSAWASHDPYSFEARFRRLDGEWRWLRATCNPRRDGAGIFQGYVGVALDFTESRRAEVELREESRTLETLNRTGAALAAELDLQRVLQMVTDAGVELSGAQFGAFFYNVMDDRGESYMLYTVSGVDRSQFDKFPMPRKTAVFAPTFDGEGVVRSDDITRDPRYGKSDTHHGMPKEHLPVRSYLAVPVVSRSEVIGGLFFGHAEPARFSERHERLLVGIAGQAAVAIDNARLFESAQKELAERRRVEEALRELNQTLEARVADAVAERERAEEALRQSQKMEAVGQLTGGIAHDFNNLLTVIAGNLDAALRRLGDQADPRVVRSLGSAQVGAERAATLTQRLLAFSRRQPLTPKPIDPNALVTGMTELLHRTLGETIQVETLLAPGLWRAEVDPHQLENALLNVAVNARDAMPQGGSLTIETSNVPVDLCPLVSDMAPGPCVLIRLTDTGTGMDPDMLARACEPFFTTKEVGKGTGLGLSMVYGFVKQSGGHFEIQSQPGEGTMVSFYLPRLKGELVDDDEGAGPRALPCGRNETVLVCEDDADVRAYTVETLRDLGYQVVEAEDGAAALKRLAENGAVDLLFTDVVLPGGMTGAELAQRAIAACPRLKVLFTTGYARDAIVHEGRLDPGIELIAKPFASADLAARIREVIDAAP